MKLRTHLGLVVVLLCSPFLMAPGCGGNNGGTGGGTGGAAGGGGGTSDGTPDVGGVWTLSFQNDLSVEVDIGGQISNPTLAAGASTVTVTHSGQPVSYTVDCSKALVTCPSELLPMTVSLTQARANPRSISVQVTESECRNGTVTEGVCSGTLIEQTSTRSGTVATDGKSFTLILGGGAVTTGSCALLTISLAEGTFVNSGTTAAGNLRADSITNGVLTTAFGGSCLLVNTAGLDPAIETAAAGASVKLRSSFTATHVR